MSDIPDWLVELAAQQDDDEEEEELETSEWDFMRGDPQSAAAIPEPVEELPEAQPSPDTDPRKDDGEADQEEDVMATLRTQVEMDEAAAALDSRDVRDRPPRRIFGLQPWQQLVLSILLLLDVVVIGLLLLAMLGRISF